MSINFSVSGFVFKQSCYSFDRGHVECIAFLFRADIFSDIVFPIHELRTFPFIYVFIFFQFDSFQCASLLIAWLNLFFGILLALSYSYGLVFLVFFLDCSLHTY